MKLLHNGEIFDERSLIFPASNRGFRYGDSAFETMLFVNGTIRFADQHTDRLMRTLSALKMNLTEFTSADFLNQNAQVLADLNHIHRGRLRFTVYRSGGGFYFPADDTCNWMMELFELPEISSSIYRRVIIFRDECKAVTPLSNFKTGNALIYVLAALHAKECGVDDCIILNQFGNVCDSIHSNVFIVRAGKLITPPLNEGCIDGIMRRQVLQAAITSHIGYSMKPITENDVMTADELFLTNAIQGIQPVASLENKQFSFEITQILQQALKD